MTTGDTVITALAPWFGGKRTLAPRIVAELGPHRAYWEPFCGSMAVLLAKPECRQETANDLHGDLVNLARVIRDPALGPALYRRLRRTLMHEDTLAEAARLLSAPAVGDDDDGGDGDEDRGGGGAASVGRAWAFFVASWMGRNGSVGTEAHARTSTFCVRYTANGGDSATRFRGAVRSIAGWRRRLGNVTILNRDGFEVLAKVADEPGTVVYLDPPYFRKAARYVHDFDGRGFMGRDDHTRLAAAARRFARARVVVSYYAHPRLAELYPGWTTVPVHRTKNLAASSSAGVPFPGRAVAPEVLLINGPALTGAAAAEAPATNGRTRATTRRRAAEVEPGHERVDREASSRGR